jgi:putative oxidoreductase
MPSLKRFNSTSDVAFRVLFSLVFVIGGMGHFGNSEAMLKTLEAAPLGHLANMFGPPDVLISLSGVALIVGGLALVVGFQTRWAALGLILVVVPITVTVHLGDPTHIGHILKNLALLGGLIHFSVKGAGAYSIDGRLNGTVD